MIGLRYHLCAGRTAAERIYLEFERAFEDEGFGLAINELEPGRSDLWEVSVYTTGEDAGELRQRCEAIGRSIADGITVNVEKLADIDWVSHALEGLKSVRAGRVLLHGSHDKPVHASSDIAVQIDAGQAFGTGHHGTTWGCLTIIQDVLKKRKPVRALDLGTGSGVLAIAMAKLARIDVTATDNDPIAIAVANTNIAINAATGIDTVVARGFDHRRIRSGGPYDLIVANILAGPLKKLAPQMSRYLAPGGDVVLSGILKRQRRAVIAAYVSCGFRHLMSLEREGWVTLHLSR